MADFEEGGGGSARNSSDVCVQFSVQFSGTSRIYVAKNSDSFPALQQFEPCLTYEASYLRRLMRGGSAEILSPFLEMSSKTFKNVIFREYRSNAYVLKQIVMKNIV